jgi:hypothetical protein
VPKILASPAYQKDGLLIITFDESNAASSATVPDPVSGRKMFLASYQGAACCNQQTGPNVTRPATIDYPVDEHEFYRVELAGIGGDRIGAVLISPFISPGTVSDLPYNHYALLRSIEDLFGFAHLGYAAQPGLVPIGPEVFNRH